MRRKDRQREDREFFEDALARASEMFLALHDGQFPYCLPFNFAAEDGFIYIHSALSGKKMDLIRQNPHTGFALAVDVLINRELSTTYYKSICGCGIAEILEDEEEKAHALDLLGRKYKARCDVPASLASVRRTAIIRIRIVQLSGKANAPRS